MHFYWQGVPSLYRNVNKFWKHRFTQKEPADIASILESPRLLFVRINKIIFIIKTLSRLKANIHAKILAIPSDIIDEEMEMENIAKENK